MSSASPTEKTMGLGISFYDGNLGFFIKFLKILKMHYFPCIFYRKPYSKYHENTWNFMDLEIVFFGCKSKFTAPLFLGMAVLGWFQPSIPMQLNFQFRGLSIDFSGFTPYCTLIKFTCQRTGLATQVGPCHIWNYTRQNKDWPSRVAHSALQKFSAVLQWPTNHKNVYFFTKIKTLVRVEDAQGIR